MNGRCSNSQSLSGKPSYKNGLRGGCVMATQLDAPEFKMKMIDAVMIPFMSQDWRVLEENLFLMDIFRDEIDRIAMRNPCADICVYKDLIMAVEVAFEQQQEIKCLETRLYEGRDDATTMVIKMGAIRLKPELEMCDLIMGKPNYKNGAQHDKAMLDEVIVLMKRPRATFANISKYIKSKYVQ